MSSLIARKENELFFNCRLEVVYSGGEKVEVVYFDGFLHGMKSSYSPTGSVVHGICFVFFDKGITDMEPCYSQSSSTFSLEI